MLVKKVDSHIDLRDKLDGPELATQPSKSSTPERKGPMIHIHDIDLPLTDDHINVTGTATIKYKLRKKSVGAGSYETPHKKPSYDIEITSIAFKDKGI